MKNKFLILLFIVLCFVYWQIFIPGPKAVIDFPLVSTESLRNLLDVPRTWSEDGTEGLGEFVVFTLWSWPLSLLSGVLGIFNLDFSFQERVLYLIPFLILGTFGIWKLAKYLKLSNQASFISSLFYLTNTYILLIIDGGQLRIALCYAILPVSFLLIEKSIYQGVRDKLLAALGVAALGFFDLRFIYILFLLTLVKFFYSLIFDLKNWKKIFVDWMGLGVLTLVVVLGLNAYWLIPLIKTPPDGQLYGQLTQTSFLSFATLGHSILLISPHWYSNIFGVISPLLFTFILIPFLVFLAPVLRSKDYWVGFWLIIAILSLFLTKGSLEPLGLVYPWLFHNIPGFSLFRDSTKFFFLVALSYSILIGITVDEVLKRLRRDGFRVIFTSFVAIYLLFLVSPAFTNQMTGILSVSRNQDQYNNLHSLLESDGTFSRVMWIPSLSPFGNIDPSHPVVEASRLVSKRPFASGVLGTYEIFNFLREAPYMGEIFDIAGIGYIAYPHIDLKKSRVSPDALIYYDTFLNQLSALPWLTRVDGVDIPTFKVKSNQERFFIPENTWWVIGSDHIYNEATASALANFSENAFVFVEEQPDLGTRLKDFPNTKIILYNKTPIDLAASFIGSSNLVFPAANLHIDPNESGWWKRDEADLIDWRYFLRSKYKLDNKDFGFGGGWAVAEGEKSLQIEPSKQDRVLLARVMHSSKGGEVDFYQGSNLIGSINTKNEITVKSEYEMSNFLWEVVGNTKNNQVVSIKTTGEINVINALAYIPRDQWLGLVNISEQLNGEGRVYYWETIIADPEIAESGNSGAVSYKKINPTLFKINVTNINHPTTVAFSENYNQYWQINHVKPIPLYSLINGFLIQENGEYYIEFIPQRNINLGLIISSVVVSIIISALIFFSFKNKKRG